MGITAFVVVEKVETRLVVSRNEEYVTYMYVVGKLVDNTASSYHQIACIRRCWLIGDTSPNVGHLLSAATLGHDTHGCAGNMYIEET